MRKIVFICQKRNARVAINVKEVLYYLALNVDAGSSCLIVLKGQTENEGFVISKGFEEVREWIDSALK